MSRFRFQYRFRPLSLIRSSRFVDPFSMVSIHRSTSHGWRTFFRKLRIRCVHLSATTRLQQTAGDLKKGFAWSSTHQLRQKTPDGRRHSMSGTSTPFSIVEILGRLLLFVKISHRTFIFWDREGVMLGGRDVQDIKLQVMYCVLPYDGGGVGFPMRRGIKQTLWPLKRRCSTRSTFSSTSRSAET